MLESNMLGYIDCSAWPGALSCYTDFEVLQSTLDCYIAKVPTFLAFKHRVFSGSLEVMDESYSRVLSIGSCRLQRRPYVRARILSHEYPLSFTCGFFTELVGATLTLWYFDPPLGG